MNINLIEIKKYYIKEFKKIDRNIMNYLTKASDIDGREVKAFPQQTTFTTAFATEKDLSSAPQSAEVDTSIIGAFNTLKRKPETRGQELPFLSHDDNTEGKSDESDLETVFGELPFKRPRSRSSTCSPESSINLNIADATLAKPLAYHDTNHESSKAIVVLPKLLISTMMKKTRRNSVIPLHGIASGQL
ncbi:b78ffe59-98ef-409a-9492-00c67ddf713d [Sclerotinia trifoliorum]|uniref:B78ffe59-98ef-409a-9492-00c67ddf713d n=1 Tax=Sclerotinia trifoliorum TaxID=28548 RepID=A0A8H2ZL25_9HELO|nr:b78ffe59-98ef-409a-9492-00c67ddf713d [Sclerotinia trifoliorum]